jgi:hypothetical protein
MKRMVDIVPDDRRGTPRKGPDCRERVKATRSLPVGGDTLPDETPLPGETPIRGVHWSNEYATVGQRHATGSRSALDFHPTERPPEGVRWRNRAAARAARLAPRALARAKARD